MPFNQKRGYRRGGINRLVALLLCLIAVMVIVIAIPFAIRQKESADEFGCMLALKKASDTMSIEYLFQDWSMTRQEAAALVDRSRYDRDQLCPGGGDYFILWQPNAEPKYRVACGLHDDDTKERTRLSSGAALERLTNALDGLRDRGEDVPAKLEIVVNGKKLSCERVEGDPGLAFGTKTDIDRKGIVCYYALAGDDASRTELEQRERVDLTGLREGEVWYFGYADPNHASIWKYGKGWRGDAWPVSR